MKFFRSIKFKLTLWYVVVLTILLLVFSTFSYFFLVQNLYTNLDNSLRARAVDIGANISMQGGVVSFVVQPQLGEMVLLYNTQGNLMLSSGPQLNPATVQTLINKALTGDTSITSAKTIDGQPVLLYATQPGSPRLSPVLVVGHSISEIQQVLIEFRQVLLIAIIVTILLAGAGGIFLAARAFKPVNDIANDARSIEESDLSRRIKVHSNDELGNLAATINEMIARLEKAFDRQRQFTADASHELRTPLSVIEAEASLALRRVRSPEDYQKSLESINEEVAYMSLILEKLLMLARADAGTEQMTFSRVNLKDLLGGVAPDIEMLAAEKGLQFQVSFLPDVFVRGDEVKLKQLLLNLLDNAIKYTRQGSISLSLTIDAKEAVIKITDTGIGIPKDSLPHVFARFYRVDKARSRSEHGTGLGLAIAKYIAESHGGRIEVSSEEGKGSIFSVYLPQVKE